MVRNRIIKQLGGTKAIALEPADLKDLNINVGSIVDIDELFKYKQAERNLTECIIKMKEKDKKC